MSYRPPLLSAREIIKIFYKLGYHKVSQKSSHIKIYNPSTESTLIIPNHKEVDRWTLKGILKDADISLHIFVNLLKN